MTLHCDGHQPMPISLSKISQADHPWASISERLISCSRSASTLRDDAATVFKEWAWAQWLTRHWRSSVCRWGIWSLVACPYQIWSVQIGHRWFHNCSREFGWLSWSRWTRTPEPALECCPRWESSSVDTKSFTRSCRGWVSRHSDLWDIGWRIES